VVAGGVGEGGHRVSEALVAGPAEGSHLAFTGLDRYRAHAGVGSHRLSARVAAATIPDLGHQAGGGDRRLGAAEQREEDLAIGMGAYGASDLGTEELDLLDQRPEGGDERQDDRSASLHLEFAGGADGRFAQTCEEVGDRAPTAVTVPGEEARKTFVAEGARIGGARVALQKGQRDRRVDVGEDTGGARPESFELGAQLVGERDASLHEVFAGTGKGLERLGLLGVGDECAEAVVIGAGQLGQAQGVEGVGFAACGPKARTGGLELVGVDGQHHEACLQQALDQYPLRALDRNPLDAPTREGAAQFAQTPLVVGESPLGKGPSGLIDDADRVLLLRPIDPGAVSFRHVRTSSLASFRCGETGREVPLRVLIARRSEARRPVAASGASHRREALLSTWPSVGLANVALSRRWSGSPRRPQFEANRSLHSVDPFFGATEQRKVAL
jgi:hypothetical protein